ncbi:hypothetical protein ACHAWO_012666 [Cyclotella atomus]|uniref:Uncharacterized protein n=1 Tax=Cyclotella atomus TaxID=382360 RepID=A0ABD3PM42_9STRA
MKFTTAIATILPLLQTSEAIYLACCQTTKECPQYYNTIDTFIEKDLTVNACCYPDEKENTQDLPECVHPIMTEDGVGISVMSLPQTKLEGANETDSTSPVLEEIIITEGNEEITIEVTSLEESKGTEDVDSTEEDSTEEANTATEETETAPYGCCAVASTVQSLRSKTQSSSVCPKDMHHVDGFTVNLSLINVAKTDLQVCCDVETQPEDVDVEAVLPCSNAVVLDHTDAEDKNASNSKEETAELKNEANALNAEDDSNGASGFGSVAFGIAALCVAVQAVL